MLDLKLNSMSLGRANLFMKTEHEYESWELKKWVMGFIKEHGVNVYFKYHYFPFKFVNVISNR